MSTAKKWQQFIRIFSIYKNIATQCPPPMLSPPQAQLQGSRPTPCRRSWRPGPGQTASGNPRQQDQLTNEVHRSHCDHKHTPPPDPLAADRPAGRRGAWAEVVVLSMHRAPATPAWNPWSRSAKEATCPSLDSHMTRFPTEAHGLVCDTPVAGVVSACPCSDFQMPCQQLIPFFKNTEKRKLKRHTIWLLKRWHILADQEANTVTAAIGHDPSGTALLVTQDTYHSGQVECRFRGSMPPLSCKVLSDTALCSYPEKRLSMLLYCFCFYCACPDHRKPKV